MYPYIYPPKKDPMAAMHKAVLMNLFGGQSVPDSSGGSW